MLQLSRSWNRFDVSERDSVSILFLIYMADSQVNTFPVLLNAFTKLTNEKRNRSKIDQSLNRLYFQLHPQLTDTFVNQWELRKGFRSLVLKIPVVLIFHD